MDLIQFIEKYDHLNTVILLEGKRDVKEADKEKLEQFGKLLASASKLMKFRSGNAKGADLYFSKGVSAVSPERLEAITPYSLHRQNENLAGTIYSLDDVNLVEEDAVVYQSKNNKKTQHLVDKYVAGSRDRFSLKAAYIIRDTVKVTGTSEILPATFAFFYDDLENPKQGGTGHTIEVCEMNNVPYFTQNVWMKWI